MCEYFIPILVQKTKKQKLKCSRCVQFTVFLVFFFYSKVPHICSDFEPKQTCSVKASYSQLEGGRSLRHGIVDKGVAERHKLVADDFDGLLCSRT